ncbi:MAG: hypothetical protein JWO36_3894 [Myxococcales bacterium]|nr:hypothetical protein [Myxococcales bacterium]
MYFPTGMHLAPDDSVLFVANANSELRYDSGSIAVFDLNIVDQVSAGWTDPLKTMPAGLDCAQDPDHTETLICDEAGFIVPHAGARLGNFATQIAVQKTGMGADPSLRLIVPTRGDPSVTWMDWDGSRLSCNPSAEGYALCDEPHRLSNLHNDPNLAVLPDEPYDVFADSTGQFAVITHLTSGAVTLVDSPIGRDAVIADVVSGLFASDPLTGLRGATGVAGRTPGAAGDIIYVGSRSDNRIQMLTVGVPANRSTAEPYLETGNFFFLDLAGANAGGSIDTRSMAFSASGDRLYLINRRPPTLQVFDTSLSATGFPKNKGLAATDICRQASTLAVADTGDGDRAYIACFQDGEIYVVDPRGLSQVEDIITVGRGPYSIAAAPSRKKLYVTNFLEDTIAVVDIAPTSKTRNRVVLRMGKPKAP